MRTYNFSLFSQIEIHVSKYVGDNYIVLASKVELIDPIGFKRKTSIWNLIDGTIAGNCKPEEVAVIHVSKKNKKVLEAYIEQGRVIKS